MAKLLCALLLCAASLPAQIVEGTVTNSVTGAGISGIKVNLMQYGDTWYSATTGAQGGFLFDHVQNGVYHATYDSPDYWWERPAGPNQQFQVTAGTPVTLEARMTPLAQLSGRVVDGRGKPVPHAQLIISGPRMVMTSYADPQGKFDMHDNLMHRNLLPDAYTLSAAPPPGFAPPDPEPGAASPSNWIRTWFPGVATEREASKIVLPPGGNVSDLEIKLLSATAHSLRGVLLDPDGKPVPKTKVTVQGDLGIQTADSDTKGAFAFPAMVDGQWFVSAEVTAPGVRLRGTQWIEISRRDLEMPALLLKAPFLVHGHMLIETPQGVPPPAARAPVFLLSRSYRAGFDSPEDYQNLSVFADADGKFSLGPLYPDTYELDGMAPSGYYLDSVRLGPTELSAPAVEFLSASLPLTLIFKTNGGRVRGTASDCDSGQVYLVPQDPARRWPLAILEARCDSQNRFEFDSARPGEYYVVAFTGYIPPPWRPTTFDGSLLLQAAKVTLRAGETSDADLRAIPPPPH